MVRIAICDDEKEAVTLHEDAPEFIFIDRGIIVNIIQIMKVADGMLTKKTRKQWKKLRQRNYPISFLCL